jgi:hypothetical protein
VEDEALIALFIAEQLTDLGPFFHSPKPGGLQRKQTLTYVCWTLVSQR